MIFAQKCPNFTWSLPDKHFPYFLLWGYLGTSSLFSSSLPSPTPMMETIVVLESFHPDLTDLSRYMVNEAFETAELMI